MKQNRSKKHFRTVGACLGVMLGGTTLLHAQSPGMSGASTNKIDNLEKENQDLKQRLDALEALAQKEGIMPTGKKADPPVAAMSDIILSGFVTTSYFHDSSDPNSTGGHSGISPGYLWDRYNDSFSLNKVKITLASPQIENTGDKFDAGYRVSLIAGQDAPIVNTKSGITGFDYLREAYIELNIPIGTGLDVRAGELISLLNYESGDGSAVNANASQGFQWFFTGNPPAEGVQATYKFADWISGTFRVNNGVYAGPIANSSSKTYWGEISLKPMDSLWLNLIGYGGRQDAFSQSLWGGSLLGGYQATKELGFGTELDYMDFFNPVGVTPAGDSIVWSGGLWTTYDFTKKVELAMRGEFVSDRRGVDASGGALGFLNPPGTGQDLASVALTLDYKPVPTIKIQPEIRWDHTSWGGGFARGRETRLIYGAALSYIY